MLSTGGPKYSTRTINLPLVGCWCHYAYYWAVYCANIVYSDFFLCTLETKICEWLCMTITIKAAVSAACDVYIIHNSPTLLFPTNKIFYFILFYFIYYTSFTILLLLLFCQQFFVYTWLHLHDFFSLSPHRHVHIDTRMVIIFYNEKKKKKLIVKYWIHFLFFAIVSVFFFLAVGSYIHTAYSTYEYKWILFLFFL